VTRRLHQVRLKPNCNKYSTTPIYHTGPTVWNSLPDELRNHDSFDGFKRFLKAILFSRYQSDQRIRRF